MGAASVGRHLLESEIQSDVGHNVTSGHEASCRDRDDREYGQKTIEIRIWCTLELWMLFNDGLLSCGNYLGCCS